MGVMDKCAKCETTTEGGQFYRFYYGVCDFGADGERTPEGKPVDPGPTFRERGSEEVYYCDRCLIKAAAREEKIRSGLFLRIVFLAVSVAVPIAWILNPGVWFALAIILLLVGVLGGSAYLRYTHLHALLCGDDPAGLRQEVSANAKIQNMGDTWAIALRREALWERQLGERQMFLTRSEYEDWSEPSP